MTLFPCFNTWVIFRHETVSHFLIHWFFRPSVFLLLLSLGIRNTPAVHALGCVVSKSVNFWGVLGIEGPCHTFYLFSSIKVLGQLFSYSLPSLISLHNYKMTPLTNDNIHFMSGLLFIVAFSSAKSWWLMAVWILHLWEEILWSTVHGLFIFGKHFELYLPVDVYFLKVSSLFVCFILFTDLLLDVSLLTCSRVGVMSSPVAFWISDVNQR